MRLLRRLLVGVALLAAPAPEFVCGTAYAAITSASRTAQYSGNGVTTSYGVPFTFQKNSDVIVTQTISGVTTQLTIGTNYTLAGAGVQSGGTVTMLVAPAIGTVITIARTVPFTQLTSLRAQGSYTPASVENALDKVTMCSQQLNDRVTALEANSPAPPAVTGSSLVIGTNGSTNRIISDHFGDWLTAKDLGVLVGDGVTDDTVGFQNAVNAACTAKLGRLSINPGLYNITNTITIPCGLTIVGTGIPPGGTQALANNYPTLVHNFNGNFLNWNGANGSAAANGGGMVNMRLVQNFGSASDGIPRGAAIYVTSSGAAGGIDHTPHWGRWDNLVIEESGNSPWSYAMLFDGTNGTLQGGILDHWISRVTSHLSGGALATVKLISVNGLWMTDCNFVVPSGPVSPTGDVVVTGSNSLISANIHILGGALNDVKLDWVSQFSLVGSHVRNMSTTLTDTTAPIVFAPGAVVSNGTLTDNSGIALSFLPNGNASTWSMGGALTSSNDIISTTYIKAQGTANTLRMAGSATGASTEIQAIGTDNNINIDLAPKGSGNATMFSGTHTFAPGGQAYHNSFVQAGFSLTNQLQINGSSANAPTQITASGGDTNIEIDIVPKGNKGVMLPDTSGKKLGFYGTAPISQAQLSTGAAHTVDDVITALQNLGLVHQ